MERSARKLAEPDLGVLAARLLFRVQGELFHRTAEQGFDDLRPRHGAVLAYLDEDGIRLADLARIAGRNKQTIAAIVDELEALGYVYRADDPADRRAKLIVPTERAGNECAPPTRSSPTSKSAMRPGSAGAPTPGSKKPSVPSPQTRRMSRNPRSNPASDYQAWPHHAGSLIAARPIVPAAFRKLDTAAVLTGPLLPHLSSPGPLSRKRWISNAIYARLRADARRAEATASAKGPGGQPGERH
jgi:DNA-binding MarR family transcriptional regulator